jgi:exocyst complex protein 7
MSTSPTVLELLEAANKPPSKDAQTDAERKILLLKSQLTKLNTTSKESTRCCDLLLRRARHLESLTTPASDASQKLSLAASNLTAVLTAMREARERFETVSDCEPTILRLHEGVMEMEKLRTKGAARKNRRASNDSSRNSSNPFDDDDLGHATSPRGGTTVGISEQDVYSAADSMEIIKDAFDYFLEHKHWKSAPTALGGIERVHKMGVNSMCTLVSSYLLSAGLALRAKRGLKEGGPIIPKLTETPEEVTRMLFGCGF